MKRALLVVIGAFLVHAWWLNCLAEDAYITYRFARNVAEGHGFVWNVGEPPIEGFTNFLWLLLCAAADRLHLDLPRFTQAVGLIAATITIAATWLFSRQVLKLSKPAALFAVTLLAAAGPFATWATSGMETVFFAMWVTLAVLFASRAATGARASDPIACALGLLAATLTRPEGFGIFVIVVLVTSALAWSADRRSGVRTIALLAGTYLPLFLLYFTWRYHTFGYLLPNTFYAKTGGGIHQAWRGFVYAVYFALHFLVPCLVWPILALWELAQRGPAPRERRASPLEWLREHAGVTIAASVVAGYTGYIVLVGGDYMAMYRFFVPILPLVFALIGIAVERAVAATAPSRARRIVLGMCAAASIGGLLLQSTPYEAAVFAPTPRMHGTYRGVQIERWHVRRFHVIGDFFNTASHDANDSIFTYDIGVVGYVTPFRIYDALGVVDRTIAHRPPPATAGQGMAGHEKQDLEYSYSREPTFVMYTVQLRPQPAGWPSSYPADLAARVQAEYALKSVWLRDPQNREQGYFTYLERRR